MCDTCTTKCPRCNLRFVNHDTYKVCLFCWKEAKGYKPTLADHAFRDLQFVCNSSCLSMRIISRVETPPLRSRLIRSAT